jgi:predicted HTH transcriptional regulator
MIFGYHSIGHSQTDLKELKNLVRQGEGLHLEFKLKSNHPEKIIREVVAFANSSGGKLLIGISDDKHIKGLKYIDEDEYVITKNIEKFIYPAIDYTIRKIKVEDEREVLVYDIKPSPFKPHYVDLDGQPEHRKAYVRIDDKSIQASKEVREIMKGERRSRDLKFTFGEKEKVLMEYLDTHKHITINTFSQIADIPRKLASRTLVLLVLTSVLKVLPHESEDLYVLSAI